MAGEIYAKYEVYMQFLDDAQDIEHKYGFLEGKYRAISHGSTKLSNDNNKWRINGGKLILLP